VRKLATGAEVPDLDKAVTLTIKTKCPAKWMLVDMETSEMYSPYDTPGKLQWKKIDQDQHPVLKLLKIYPNEKI
jgi:hypothetical protein